MTNLNNTLKSVIKSFDSGESINFVDLRFIDDELKGEAIVNRFIDKYNKSEPLNFALVLELKNIILSKNKNK